MSPLVRSLLVGAVCAALGAGAWAQQRPSAQQAAIRKALTERLPNFPAIDEVSKSPMPGLWEVRIGTDVLYTDEQGNYLIQGELIDTRSRANLTKARVEKLTAIDFASLPLKDAVVWKQGNGARKLVQFTDPNCPYCKRFERDLANVKDVTVYTFLYPILGGDSPDKARAVWCAKDSAKVWRDWMLKGTPPPSPAGACDAAAIERNVAFGRKHRLNGTPTILFEDGSRVPGAMNVEQVEQRLVAAAAAAAK